MVIVKSCLLKNFNLRPRPDLICAYYYMLIYNVLVLWKKNYCGFWPVSKPLESTVIFEGVYCCLLINSVL